MQHIAIDAHGEDQMKNEQEKDQGEQQNDQPFGSLKTDERITWLVLFVAIGDQLHQLNFSVVLPFLFHQ